MISRQSTLEGMNRPASVTASCSTASDAASNARAPPCRGSLERKTSVRYNQAISSSNSCTDSSCKSPSLVPQHQQLHHHLQQLPPRKPPANFNKHRLGMMKEAHASPIKRQTKKQIPWKTSGGNSQMSSSHTSVRFAPDSEILYIPVPSLAELSHADVTAQWWSPNEFFEHRTEYKATVQRMEQVEANQQSEQPTLALFASIEGSRGLEQRTEDGAWKYYTTKRTSSEAVIAEQTRFRTSVPDASCHKSALCIAHVYAQCVELAVKEGLDRARYDAEQVGITIRYTTPVVSSSPDIKLDVAPRRIVKESTSGKKNKDIAVQRPPVTPGRPRDLPPFQPKTPTRVSDEQRRANNQCLSGSHHSVTSRVLQERPRLVRETAASQRHLMDTTASPTPYTSPPAVTPGTKSTSLDNSRHSVTSTASRPRLRREYVISSKRDLECSVKSTVAPTEYNLDVSSLMQSGSQRSLFSISSQVLSSPSRPKLRRETGVSSKKTLVDTDEKARTGTSERTLPMTIIYTADNDTTPEGSQRSLNSISSQVSSSSLRPRLRREPTASGKSLLSSKSNKSIKSNKSGKSAKLPPQPSDDKEIVLPPRIFSDDEPSVPSKAKGARRDSKREKKQVLALQHMGESVDSFANSLESPLSTSASSASTRPGLRRQQSIVLKTSARGADSERQRRKSNIRFVDEVIVLPCPDKPVKTNLSEHWLSPQELVEIQNRATEVVAWMEQGIPVISESSRGLESSTGASQQELVERRRGVCQLVLQRQAELKNSKTMATDKLAELYKAATKEARTVAFVYAKLDAKDAQEHQSMYPCMI